MKKIKLSFVNKGKEFELPKLTVEINEQALLELSKIKKKMSNEEFGSLIQRIRLWKCLQKVDKSVKLEDINNMHPDDYYILLNIMLSGGRELKDDDTNFR